MSRETLDLLLVALFASVALCAISLVLLRMSVPRNLSSDDDLLARGAIPPHTAAVSMRAKFFLPWVYPAQFASAGLFPRVCFWTARLGAYGAVGVLVWFVAAMLLFG
jgi:hypothetical protein